MDSEIIRAVQRETEKEKLLTGDKKKQKQTTRHTRNRAAATKISDDLYKDVITPLRNEFSEPIVSPHWWKKPAENLKAFAAKTRINNTIWRQWYVHFVEGKDTEIKFANPMPLADKYHARVLAVVVEGHYWCRKHRAIRAQYNSWRKTRKNALSKLKIDNLIANKKREENEDSLSLPPVDDLVLSGMLNGFNDLEALDLSVQFDLPEILGSDIMTQSDSFLDDILQPSECGVDLQKNGLTTNCPASEDNPVLSRNDTLDTTSLNTLATAANMSQYFHSSFTTNPDNTHFPPPAPYPSTAPSTYPHTARYPDQSYIHHPLTPETHLTQGSHQYNEGGGDGKKRGQYHIAQSGLYQEGTNYTNIPEHTATNPGDGNTFLAGNVPPCKGPGYYPPTQLQYNYSDKDTTFLTHSQPEYTAPTQKQKPAYKQKLSEVEVDRKRRRAMKDKLANLHGILPSSVFQSGKQTHAGLLNKAAEYLMKEEADLRTVEGDIVKLTTEIEETKRLVAAHQGQIPENGISSACHGSKEVEEAYRGFLEEQGGRNPLMKLYSTMLEPLFFSFNNMVDNSSLDAFCRSAHQWFSQNCSLGRLREYAMNLVINHNLEFEGHGDHQSGGGPAGSSVPTSNLN